MTLKYKILSLVERESEACLIYSSTWELFGALIRDYEFTNARSRLIQWSFRVGWVVRSERVIRIAKLAIEQRSARVSRVSVILSNGLSPQAVASFTRQAHPSTRSSMHTSRGTK